MPTRAQVGRGGRHERLDHPAQQQEDDEAEGDAEGGAPSAPRACTRAGTRLDPRPEEPSPTPAATKRQVSSSIPCGAMRPKKGAAPVPDHDRADDRDVEHVHGEHVEHGQAEDARGHAQRGQPEVVGPDAQRERRRGVLAVVVGEVVLDELADLLGRGERALDGGVLHQPPAHGDGQQDVDDEDGDPPPADPVQRGGKDWPKNRPTSDHDMAREPAERERARASSIDR